MLLKNIVAAVIFFSFHNLLCAQESKINEDRENFFRFGGKVGVNINKISGQSYKAGFGYNYQLGGFLQFNLNKRFGIQPEVNFVQSSSQFTNDETDIYDDLFMNGDQVHATLNRLEIPVLLNVNVGQSKHVKLQLGPAYGTKLKEAVDSLVANRSIYRNSDWSLIGGLWIQLPLINLGARYKYGLTNINAIDDRQTWKGQSIQIFLGLTF